MSKIEQNTTNLQAILAAVNALPEAGSGGAELPELTNEGTSEDLLFGKQLIDGDGNIVTGTIPSQDGKTVTPTTSEQTVVESGVYTTGEVKVGAIPSEYVIPSGSVSITENGTVDVSQYASAVVNVEGSEEGGNGAGFPNGATWTQSNISDYIPDLAYANGVWVACANHAIYYSTDGKTWLAGYNEVDAYFHRVAYGRGKWFAASEYGLLSSTDGKSWQYVQEGECYYHYLEYVNDKWYRSATFIVNDAEVMHNEYSINGVDWFGITFAYNTKSLESVTYADGMWMATQFSTLYYSSDGVSFSESLAYGRATGKPCYANGLWVVPHSLGVAYSTDGMTWETHEFISSSINNIRLISYADGLYVACSNPYIYVSTDGVAWTITQSLPDNTNAQLLRVNHAESRWIIYGPTEDTLTSTDGRIWEQNPYRLISVLHANGIWVAMASTGLYYSITWEPS